MANRTLRIGTRASVLALWQANWVKDELEKRYPDLEAHTRPWREVRAQAGLYGGVSEYIHGLSDGVTSLWGGVDDLSQPHRRIVERAAEPETYYGATPDRFPVGFSQ